MSTITLLGSAVALAAMAGMATAETAPGTYTADLAPLNASAAGAEARGTATLTVADDTLTIKIDMTGTAPEIMHLQHFHGFADGSDTSKCPTSTSDANGDGIVDLMETEPDVGVTMVPFHADPVSMAIVADTYPKADAEGAYSYEQSVSVSALEKAFAAEFPGQDLDLGRRVVMIHGVAEGTDLPSSVASLGDVPAHVTLPIACGDLRKADS